MTPKQKDDYILKSLDYWRGVFSISPELKIKLKYVTNREDDGIKYATITRDMLPYKMATLEIFDEVLSSKDFKRVADENNLPRDAPPVLSQVASYLCSKLTSDGEARYAEDLEEEVVTTLERAFAKVRTASNKR